MQLYTSASDCKCVGNIPGSHFVKAFSALPSHSYLFMSVTTQKRRPFNADFSRRNGYKSAGASWGEYVTCSSVFTLFCAKNSLTKTDRCAGALFWRRKQLFVLHLSGRLLMIASLRRRKMSLYINLFTVTIPVNYTNEFRERFETIAYCTCTMGWHDYWKIWIRKFMKGEFLRNIQKGSGAQHASYSVGTVKFVLGAEAWSWPF